MANCKLCSECQFDLALHSNVDGQIVGYKSIENSEFRDLVHHDRDQPPPDKYAELGDGI